MLHYIELEVRETGHTFVAACTDSQYRIARLLDNLHSDLTSMDISNSHADKVVDGAYEKLCWWDYNKFMLCY